MVFQGVKARYRHVGYLLIMARDETRNVPCHQLDATPPLWAHSLGAHLEDDTHGDLENDARCGLGGDLQGQWDSTPANHVAALPLVLVPALRQTAGLA